jgi:hypothetical protein
MLVSISVILNPSSGTIQTRTCIPLLVANSASRWSTRQSRNMATARVRRRSNQPSNGTNILEIILEKKYYLGKIFKKKRIFEKILNNFYTR